MVLKFFNVVLEFSVGSYNRRLRVVHVHVSQKKGQKCCLLNFCTVDHFMLQAFQSHGLFHGLLYTSLYTWSDLMICFDSALCIIVAPNMLYSRIRFVQSELLPENQQHV